VFKFKRYKPLKRWHVKKDVEEWVSKCREVKGSGVGAGLRRHGSRV